MNRYLKTIIMMALSLCFVMGLSSRVSAQGNPPAPQDPPALRPRRTEDPDLRGHGVRPAEDPSRTALTRHPDSSRRWPRCVTATT